MRKIIIGLPILVVILVLLFPARRMLKTQRSPAALYFHGNPFRCLFGHNYPIHLTFDDGPMDTGTTQDLLDVLKSNSIQATFFIQGDRLDPQILDPERKDPKDAYIPPEFEEFSSYHYGEKDRALRAHDRIELVKRERAEGHLVGTHTLVHRFHNVWPNSPAELEKFQKEKYWRYYIDSQQAMEENIARGKAIVEKQLGAGSVHFIRLPFGAGALSTKPGSEDRRKSEIAAHAFSALGLLHIGWNIDSMDYYFGKMEADPQTGRKYDSDDRYNILTEHVAEDLCKTGGGIILFHDNYPVAAKYLPRWIPLWREAGHRIVSLKELYPKCFDEAEAQKLHSKVDYDEKTGELKQCWNE